VVGILNAPAADIDDSSNDSDVLLPHGIERGDAEKRVDFPVFAIQCRAIAVALEDGSELLDSTVDVVHFHDELLDFLPILRRVWSM
jgi:hypothetical protein